MTRNQWRRWLTKITRWEFWPFALVYGPILPIYAWFCIKARSFFFFTATNPGIEYGGFVMESKWKIAQIIPESFQPKTIFVGVKESFETAAKAAEAIGFPLFAKPDIGGKGAGVAVLKTQEDLRRYHQSIPADFLLQEPIPLPVELGIFYVRLPHEKHGRVTGIVSKEFLAVTGDGLRTVEQLLQIQPRLAVYIPALEKTIPSTLKEVLKSGEYKMLVPYGNHARGATFWDVSIEADEQLNAVVDTICSQIRGFDFGRIDIRCHSIESFRHDGPFSIIEVNGAGSEPTHMYDPRNSIFDAWSEIIKHWRWMYKVAVANHRLGLPYLGFHEGRRLLKASAAFEKQMAAFHFDSK